MALATAKSFLEKVVNDSGFRQQILALKDPTAVLDAAKKAGFDFTEAEMKSVIFGSGQGASTASVASGDTAAWVGAGGSVAGAGIAAGAAAAACV